MSFRVRFIILVVALFTVIGCSEFSPEEPEVTRLEETSLVRTLQYNDRGDGPRYDVSLMVPEEWVGDYDTLNRGNSLAFRRLEDADDESGRPVFYIEALSNAQYWEQIGSYPGQYVNIANTADTYFVYYFPIDPYYSGLTEAEFDDLKAQVPEIVRSINIERVEE